MCNEHINLHLPISYHDRLNFDPTNCTCAEDCCKQFFHGNLERGCSFGETQGAGPYVSSANGNKDLGEETRKNFLELQ